MLRRSPVTSGAGAESAKPKRPPEPPGPPAAPPPPAMPQAPPAAMPQAPGPRSAKAGLPSRPPVTLPKRTWRAISVAGLLVAVAFSVLPVGARFGDDPLLRLRELNPELSPPAPTAACGAAIGSLNVQPRDTSLFEAAEARACERAARRRVFGAVAAGAILMMVGLLGVRGGIPSPARPRPH